MSSTACTGEQRSSTKTDGLQRVITSGETTGVCFAYDADGYLTTITDVDGTQSTYAYDEDGRLATAQSAEGLRLVVSYEPTALHRVTYLARSGEDAQGELEGARRSYQYELDMTITRDETVPDGKRKFYLFNNWGNQVGVRDELGFAGFAKYSPDSLPNHPDMVSKLMKTTTEVKMMHSSRHGWVYPYTQKSIVANGNLTTK